MTLSNQQTNNLTSVERVRIALPGNTPNGVAGKVVAIIRAYPGWPCALLYIKLTEGERIGQTIRILANKCVAMDAGVLSCPVCTGQCIPAARGIWQCQSCGNLVHSPTYD